MRITSENRANTVNAEIANTVVKGGVTAPAHRNAYELNPIREYNARTSARRLTETKMYADLTRKQKREKRGIKSPRDNKVLELRAFADQAIMQQVPAQGCKLDTLTD